MRIVSMLLMTAVFLCSSNFAFAEEAKEAENLVLTGRIFNTKLGDYERSATTLIIKTDTATYILQGRLCNELWKNRDKAVKLEVQPLKRASYFYGTLTERAKVIKIEEIDGKQVGLTEDKLEPNYTIEEKDGKTIIKVKVPEGKDDEEKEDTPVWLE